jgi:hypothetical protein
MDPLAPVEPRVGGLAGLRDRVGGGEDPGWRGRLEGRVLDGEGAPVAGAHIEITAGADRVVTESDDAGRFGAAGLAAGEVELAVSAPGYRSARATAAVDSGDTNDVELRLVRRLPAGQIRGVVRSLAGRAIDARVRIEPLGVAVATRAGRFQVDVPPGAHHVVVTAPGHQSQRRRVVVDRDGVVVLNIELRSLR